MVNVTAAAHGPNPYSSMLAALEAGEGSVRRTKRRQSQAEAPTVAAPPRISSVVDENGHIDILL